MAFKVVLTTNRVNSPYEEEVIKNIGGDLVRTNCPTEDEVIAACHDADAAVGMFEPFSRRVVEKLERCRIIASIGIAYDKIDVVAATEHGIIVTNVPDYCLEELSDHTMALLLALNRKLIRVDRKAKEGKWGLEARQVLPPMHPLRGRTLGLVGFGRVPRTIVRKAQAFGLRVIAYDPYVTKASVEGHYVELVNFDRLLAESDFVSCHAAVTPDNYHMFGLEQFKKMKPTAYFINTARGALVDEAALYTALTQGHIQGAALDVMEQEPPRADHPLLSLDNVIITCHTGQYSDTAIIALRQQPFDEVARVLRGEWPVGWLNPQVKDRYLERWGRNQE